MLSRRLLRIKALKALYAHVQCEGDNLIAAQKKLLGSIDRSYDLYFLIMRLPVEIAEYARTMQQIASEKHLATREDLNPNKKFVNSQFIHLFENSDTVNDYLHSRKLSWKGEPEFIKLMYTKLTESERYKRYMLSPESSMKEDLALMDHLFVTMLQEIEEVEPTIEHISLDMVGDLCHILPLVMRTMSSIRPNHTDVKVVKKFKCEEDLAFVRGLFERSLINLTKYQTYIEKFTSNWDVERIVFMDNLIMVVAMAELINFPDIPTKVTMDEYIEISKYYSTPSSSVFVNGILDKMTNSLTEEGEIKKVGRGLM
ncbi:MAG: transcription antitermination protein NusB [Rikenellaceae bacterium]